MISERTLLFSRVLSSRLFVKKRKNTPAIIGECRRVRIRGFLARFSIVWEQAR
jgi:hypothetical protein